MSYNLVVMGTSCVGKSALTVQLVRNRFVRNYNATIEDSYLLQTVVDGEACRLDILDTAGLEQFYRLRDQYMRWGEGFLFVYAVDDPYSFEILSGLWDKLRRIKKTDRVPMVLVANKTDKATWRVDSTLGREVAKSFGVPFVETSAKTRKGVEHAFHELVREIRQSEAAKELSSRRDAEGVPGCGFKHCTIL